MRPTASATSVKVLRLVTQLEEHLARHAAEPEALPCERSRRAARAVRKKVTQPTAASATGSVTPARVNNYRIGLTFVENNLTIYLARV